MEAKVTHPIELEAGCKFAAFLGAIAGLVGYLAVGLLPSLVHGGWTGVALAAWLFGIPIDASWMARGVIVFSMVIVLLVTAAGFVILGAALGAGGYSLLRALGSAK